MATSFCSNWGTLQYLNPEINTFQQRQAELARELYALCHNPAPPSTFVDPFFDPDNISYSENYTDLLPYFSSPSNHVVSLSPEIFPHDEYEYCQYPKRPKSYQDLYYSELMPSCFHGYVPNSPPVPEFLPEILLPSTELQIPPVYYCDNVEEGTKKPNNGCLSAQSISARQRRRKITEKTQVLGKLIPGGTKMNTAEMLQAASKYVRYLQAQVKLLELMGSIQESKGPPHGDELQVLLSSPLIQEKLSSEEKCLVPKQFAETLAEDKDIQSNRLISEDLERLIQTKG
ncbi:hypothetical protein HHK36_013222 [Tetracentron sinense]|uniref:BHLH domain-containing protein n=1 Tax=Tetracentron sinense TaxID=13715 RepID=A0A834ZA97_TETSI|nr:hypothetical protein HHK36_013222 [Tetracentron sinense]